MYWLLQLVHLTGCKQFWGQEVTAFLTEYECEDTAGPLQPN